MDEKMVKVYAAYRSGCLGDNILHTYFRFFANIIYEQQWEEVNEGEVADAVKEKYGIDLPLPFVRQVLGVGMDNNAIVDNHGKYIAQRDVIRKFQFNSKDFDRCWDVMRSKFGYFCKKEKLDLGGINVEERILDAIESYDEKVVVGDELDSAESVDVFDFAWKKFLISMAQESNSTYDFIASMSACNIMKQAIFFTESALDTFSGLNVYLDSPMVFALLGMDVPARVDSCKRLVEKAQEAGCTVMVFDHNYREAEGIISRAASWARSSEYSIDKANNVARFFHDSDMSYPEMIEFCEEIEDKLAELNITIKTTNYDVLSNDFQEDEEKLKDMIIQRYAELGQRISEEKRNSVAVDVRSIIMVYRERNGQVSSKIQTSRDIMLTLNGTIANVSKKYESNQSINAGHIPACISADLFGAVMWLFSPVEFINYQKKQLLADCYIALRPSKALMSKYVESLIYARNAGEIDEKKFLFMRSHSVVHEALMNVTKGDYARFNERTYREVYDEITEKAEQHYRQEVAAHSETQRLWDESEEANKRTIHNLLEELKTWRSQEANRTRRTKNVVGWVYTAIFAGMPYLVSTIVVEILKLVLIENTPDGWLYAGLFALVTLVIAVMCKKIKLFCFALAQKHVEARKARKVVKPSKEVLLGQKSE